MIRGLRRIGSALAAALTLVACTGTQEGVDAVLLVVVTEDAVGLVHHVRSGDSRLEWLEDATDPLPPGVVPVDAQVARYAGPDENSVHVELVYRVADEDFLQTYDASFVPPDEADRFVRSGPPVNLSADVVAPGGEIAEPLCTTGFDVSADGRWLALVHDPGTCGYGGGRALIVVDRDGDGDLRVIDRDVGAVTFAPSDDRLFYVDEFDPAIRVVSLESGADAPIDPDLPAELEPLTGLAAYTSERLVVSGSDAVAAVDPTDDEAPSTQESLGGLAAVLDADLPEGPAITVRTGSRIVTHPDPALDEDDPFCASTNAGIIVDAVVGPFAFAYVLVDERLVVYDLYGCDPEASGTSTLPAGPTLEVDELADAVALAWIFGAAPEPDAP